MSATTPADAVAPRARGSLTLSRLGRLALKELRETLRDRRTIITLILMPLLVYPLLSLGFRQFFLSSVARQEPIHVRIGVASEEQHQAMARLLALGHELLERQAANAEQVAPPQPRFLQTDQPPEFSSATFEYYTPSKPGQAIQDLAVDLAIRLESRDTESGRGQPGGALKCDIWYQPESTLSRRAAEYIEHRLRAVNENHLQMHFQALGEGNLADRLPVAWAFVPLAGQGEKSFWLASLVPLVLIIMTITGAVYPSIDLTAGERERGTLESLMAAPVPRLGLLMAKYVAVVTVAMLTAVMNLLAMSITVTASGLGPMLFGEQGLSASGIFAVFALLMLFAAFFSAVLLSITSFARSFKEAQAYLIPLMLISLAPGFLSVVPGVELNAPLSITPLANIVLLARDVLEGDAPPIWATVAVLSTLLYGALALAIAARIFGSDAILYGSEGSWGDLFRRPPQPRPQATLAGALTALAVVGPLFVVVNGFLSQLHGSAMWMQLAASGVIVLLLFAGIPMLLARLQGVELRSGFQWRGASLLALLGAVVLGCSLAPLAYELIIVSREAGFFTISHEQLTRLSAEVNTLTDQWRELSPVLILLALAVAPAVGEELFFRGYLLGSLRGRAPAWLAIGITGLVFGLFHASIGGLIAVERVLASTVLGIVLGWVCWTSRSVVPGMVLHALNNGLLLSLAYWGEGLKSLGLDVKDQQHLPAAWLAGSAAVALAGISLVYFGRRADAAAGHSPLAAPLPSSPEVNAR